MMRDDASMCYNYLIHDQGRNYQYSTGLESVKLVMVFHHKREDFITYGLPKVSRNILLLMVLIDRCCSSFKKIEICEFVFFRNSSVHSTYKCIIQMISFINNVNNVFLVQVAVLVLKIVSFSHLKNQSMHSQCVPGSLSSPPPSMHT